ncbi:MAG: SAM-dependent methyltransferase [Bacteroidetes bacterium]|nr:MAG: SAM-dependent methyltransferase [Bacteroidota bacterium]
MQNLETEKFLQKLEDSFQKGKFVKLTLSKPRIKQSDLKNIIISPVKLKAGLVMHFVFRYKTRDEVKNFSIEESLLQLPGFLNNEFFNADMYLEGENHRLLFNRKNEAKVLIQKVDIPAPLSLEHNRIKERVIETYGNIWLRELGVLNDKWQVRHEMKDKFVQINKYIELLEPELLRLESKDELKIADMGSGKGYLTFALYDYLKGKTPLKPVMYGVEHRQDLVDKCNDIAKSAGFDDLHFLNGTIEETDIPDANVLIALHACDTATDDAIAKGIKGGASLIVCAPCCQKQVRKEMEVPGELSGLLKHGILLERQAELLTDGLRAMIMEVYGYKTKVFEFIDLEHTAKNVMIVGRKTVLEPAKKDKLLQHITHIKQLYGIRKHYLEELLGM